MSRILDLFQYFGSSDRFSVDKKRHLRHTGATDIHSAFKKSWPRVNDTASLVFQGLAGCQLVLANLKKILSVACKVAHHLSGQMAMLGCKFCDMG